MILVPSLLAGCAGNQAANHPTPSANVEAALQQPPTRTFPTPATKTEGSLFSDDPAAGPVHRRPGPGRGRYRHHQRGRILQGVGNRPRTILAVKTRSGRNPGPVGIRVGHTRTSGHTHLQRMINAKFSSGFTGSGTTTRNESMTAQISARVLQKLPTATWSSGGPGRCWSTMKGNSIIIQGVIRPQDISPDNTIQSNFIADARNRILR